MTEAFQYYLLKSSNAVAVEKGPCTDFNRTKYFQGILPIDTYKRDVDEIANPGLNYDWEGLRVSIAKHGLRHSTLSAQMPSESSSVVSNATNGIEPPRGYLSIKKKKSKKKVYLNRLSLVTNISRIITLSSGICLTILVILMLLPSCRSSSTKPISGNWSYNPENYPDNEVPTSVMAQDFLRTYKYGWKTSYYQNTYDNKTDEIKEDTSNEQLKVLEQMLMESQEEDCEMQQNLVNYTHNGETNDRRNGKVFNTSTDVDSRKQPMFFGQPLGLQRYDSYKYPIFDKLTQQQLGYFWRPEEVSLQKDRSDYQQLRPEQKHIFTSNLKYQIMLDSVQGRGPAMNFPTLLFTS